MAVAVDDAVVLEVVRDGPTSPELRASVGLADVAEAAGMLARIAGLRIFVVSPRGISLGDPAGARPFLGIVHQPVRDPDDAAVCRITFGVASIADLSAAASHAVRMGAGALRALRDDDTVTVHVAGPDGVEIGFVHRTSPWDPGGSAVTAPRSFAAQRITSRVGQRRGPIWLDHVTLGHASPPGTSAIRGGQEALSRDVSLLRTRDGRPAAIATRCDGLSGNATLLSVG